MSILILAINYQTEQLAERFVHSIAQCHGAIENIKIILVDNTLDIERNKYLAQACSTYQNVDLLITNENLGYFGGARFGMEAWLSGNEIPDWVIVSNVDIEFADCDFFRKLEQMTMDTRSSAAGVIAPSIWSKRSQRDINPKITERPGSARMRFYRTVFGNYYLGNAYMLLSSMVRRTRSFLDGMRKKDTGEAPEDAGTRRIYAPHGSCIVFSDKYFEKGGTLDYPQFLFNEEVFVAEEARRLGLDVIYEPGLKVVDDEHASTGILSSRKILAHVADSARYVYATYFER